MNSNVEKLVRLMIKGAATKADRAERVALWNSLSPDEQQQTEESRMFVGFVQATSIVADPFAHINENPPRPDIRTSIDGRDYYFELGEITDEGLAKSISDSLKTKMVSGRAISQDEPLENMLKKKCKKTYETDGAPIDLLLYYWRQGPYEESIANYLRTNCRDIEARFRSSQFIRIWIYDWPSGRVLSKIER
ncbi:MAG: hypothetical protein P4L03_02215 [Terracidiphilus sp.]|nr:hypothetical protein [Terracidiphilus sp.]